MKVSAGQCAEAYMMLLLMVAYPLHYGLHEVHVQQGAFGSQAETFPTGVANVDYPLQSTARACFCGMRELLKEHLGQCDVG